MKPFFGYPGGKSKVAGKIFDILEIDKLTHKWYVEPFSGGFSMGLHIVPICGSRAWINDLDKDLYSLWVASIYHTEEFCDLIKSARITKDSFYSLQEKILSNKPFHESQIMERAIDKLVIHKISFSNMGEMSGSPVGGKKQEGDWKFDCRWNVDSICGRIKKASILLKGCKITSWPYQRVLASKNKDMLFYIDPPYIDAGSKCYKHSFQEQDHRKLARDLTKLDHNWFLTYDRNPLVFEIFEKFNIVDLNFQYYMSSRGRKNKPLNEGKELLISNF